jgi:hypothetical protein
MEMPQYSLYNSCSLILIKAVEGDNIKNESHKSKRRIEDAGQNSYGELRHPLQYLHVIFTE